MKQIFPKEISKNSSQESDSQDMLYLRGKQAQVCMWVGMGEGNLLMQIVSHILYFKNLLKFGKKTVGTARF